MGSSISKPADPLTPTRRKWVPLSDNVAVGNCEAVDMTYPTSGFDRIASIAVCCAYFALEGIASHLNSTEAKAGTRSDDTDTLQYPLLTSTSQLPRPYGLPVEMEGKRSHIWELIFERVDDCETITNLREVCVMFTELLERKYAAAMQPLVIGNRFANLSVHWEGGTEDWLKTLLDLRTLSKASKTSVDSLLDEGLIGVDGTNWFSTKTPHYLLKKDMPILELGASGRRLQRFQTAFDKLNDERSYERFPLPSLIFDEIPEFGRTINLSNFHTCFGRVVEKVGYKITSFQYFTKEKSFETYVNLGKWLIFMPNLRDLIVELQGFSLLRSWEETGKITIEPFLTCPRLKRYAEGPKGFGVPFLKEILRANPTIQEVLLGETSRNEWDNIVEIIDALPMMTKLHSTCIPVVFKNRFHWAKQLTTLALWDPEDNWIPDISSKVLLDFKSQFENLVELLFASPFVRDTGGCLELHKLEQVTWKVFPTFKTLNFLKPAKRLRCLSLDMSECVDTKPAGKFVQFLIKWNILSSYPKLRKIRKRTQRNGEFSPFLTIDLL